MLGFVTLDQVGVTAVTAIFQLATAARGGPVVAQDPHYDFR